MVPFHLAFPVRDLESTRHFYVNVLGCSVGRESDIWIDFNFFGHQITAHCVGESAARPPTNPVDGKDVPIPHFGAVLEWEQWHAVADKLRSANMTFIIEPYLRFAGKPGEQATMFFADPSGNYIELKSFKDPGELFRRD